MFLFIHFLRSILYHPDPVGKEVWHILRSLVSVLPTLNMMIYLDLTVDDYRYILISFGLS